MILNHSYLFFMTSTTPKKMITNRRMPAITPAIFTVWSVCFSGSTASGFLVAAPGTNHQMNAVLISVSYIYINKFSQRKWKFVINIPTHIAAACVQHIDNLTEVTP